MRAAGTVCLYLGVLASVGGTLVAQTAISADGIIESTAGGFRFPDGSVQTTAVGAPAPVEDTGQTQCFDSSGVSRACTGTGEDGDLLPGVAWPTPRFTDNGDGTVTDNLTDLIWLKDANCPAGSKTWQEALDWVVLLNTTSIACTDYVSMTFSDWRLPSVKELLSLVDYGRASPALPSSHPFVAIQSGSYWSSTSWTTPTFAWVVALSASGDTGSGVKTSSTGKWVWPVRGGQ